MKMSSETLQKPKNEEKKTFWVFIPFQKFGKFQKCFTRQFHQA